MLIFIVFKLKKKEDYHIFDIRKNEIDKLKEILNFIESNSDVLLLLTVNYPEIDVYGRFEGTKFIVRQAKKYNYYPAIFCFIHIIFHEKTTKMNCPPFTIKIFLEKLPDRLKGYNPIEPEEYEKKISNYDLSNLIICLYKSNYINEDLCKKLNIYVKNKNINDYYTLNGDPESIKLFKEWDEHNKNLFMQWDKI